jgi:uncharacterized protein (TIGR00251 family)
VAGWYRWDGRDLLLDLKLQARASRDAFAEPREDRLRVRITAPPVDGRANAHLTAWLAGWLAAQFGVKRSSVSIEKGQTSPLKRVRVSNPKRLPGPLGLPRGG